MNKSRTFVIGIFVFWIIAIGAFVLSKEMVLSHGRAILIPVEPVDPRDVFRGDYINLNYNISNFDRNLYFDTQGEGNPNTLKKGDVLYVMVESSTGRVESVLYYSDTFERINEVAMAQKDQNYGLSGMELLVLKAVVERDDPYSKRIFVKYGIESFFVPEGVGREIEKCGRLKCVDEPITGVDSGLRSRTEETVPMYAKARVDENGNLVLESLILSNGEEVK